ncbi:MAG: 50S ribosomal protein L13 [Candidatus Dependentiae bacterium]|nr:50S ribosomal protein L13 [Candidatus Dependentiae bacterium]
MNTAFFLKKEARQPEWHLIDAEGKVLGRLATEIADRLRGKDKPFYTPHTDSGDYVVVINAEKIVLTGKKWTDKTYDTYSGWIGGLKTVTAEQVREKHPERIIELAVKRMLPKNILNRYVIRKLRVYAGDQHRHIAQLTKKA